MLATPKRILFAIGGALAIFAIGAAIFLITHETFAEKFGQIDGGDSEEAVTELLGQPDKEQDVTLFSSVRIHTLAWEEEEGFYTVGFDDAGRLRGATAADGTEKFFDEQGVLADSSDSDPLSEDTLDSASSSVNGEGPSSDQGGELIGEAEFKAIRECLEIVDARPRAETVDGLSSLRLSPEISAIRYETVKAARAAARAIDDDQGEMAVRVRNVVAYYKPTEGLGTPKGADRTGFFAGNIRGCSGVLS